MKNQPYIPKRNWRKWLIVSAAVAGVLVLSYFYFFVWFEPTGVEAEIWDLAEEMKGYPPDYFDDLMKKCGLDFLLKKKPTPRDDKWEIVKDLAKIGKPAVPKLIELLNYKDSEVRLHTAMILGKIGDTRAVEPLINRLNDEEWLVRNHTAKALGKIGDPRAVKPLIAALKDYEYLVRPFVRRSAALALGEIGDPLAADPLVILLNDEDPRVEHAAMVALCMIPNEKTEKIIKSRINEKIRKFVPKGLVDDNKIAAGYDGKIFLQQFEFKRKIYFVPTESKSDEKYWPPPYAVEKKWTDKFIVAQEIKYRWTLDSIGPLLLDKDEDKCFTAIAKIKLNVISRQVVIGKIGKTNIPKAPAGMKIWIPLIGLRYGEAEGPECHGTRLDYMSWQPLPTPDISSDEKNPPSPKISQAKTAIGKISFKENNYSIDVEISFAKSYWGGSFRSKSSDEFPWEEFKLQWEYGIPHELSKSIQQDR